jgi:hypothetical protein
MPAINPQPADKKPRRRLAPPKERAQARAVAHLVDLIDDPNVLVRLAVIAAHFPGIKLETALCGYVFRKLLVKQPPEGRVLQ